MLYHRGFFSSKVRFFGKKCLLKKKNIKIIYLNQHLRLFSNTSSPSSPSSSSSSSSPSLPPSPDNKNKNVSTPIGFWDKMIAKYGPQTIQAPMNFNRWKIVPLAISTHLCLGACYAWSIFNEPLTRELGVVTSSSGDWLLGDVVGTFMGIIVAQGLAMAVCGKWVERVGPRIAGITGSLLYGGGMIIGAGGVYYHTLPLVYLGYGVLAGTGMGIAYLPPVATLIRWFPDKRGLATGMAICGFGGGAIFITSIKKKLLMEYFKSPKYLGNNNNVITKRDTSGKLLTQINNNWNEVVNVTSKDLNHLGANLVNKYHLNEGIYLVGTGNTGIAATMGILGLGYLLITGTSALLIRVPQPEWKPDAIKQLLLNDNNNNNKKTQQSSIMQPENVHIDDVMKIPQFWLLWVTFLSTATAGMGLMSCAKDVLTSCFVAKSSIASNISTSTAAFAATYVQALSLANLGGRFLWASASDKVGRKNTFTIFCALGAPIYFGLPYIIHSSLDMQSYTPLILFYGSTMAIISFFGGGYSTIPAYESDLFGTKYIGAVHGRMMTASALSGIAGPMIFAKLYEQQQKKAIEDLTSKCDSNAFLEKFGTGKENLSALIESKAVKINNLLEICPPGTMDPTPYLYDPAFKTMGIVMGLGALANFAVKPVHSKWHEINRNVKKIK